jgi:hypothetical protein
MPFVRYKKGDVFSVNRRGAERGFGPVGAVLSIFTVKMDGDDPSYGIFSEKHNNNFHDLGGLVESGHGYWFSSRDIHEGLNPYNQSFVISSDFEFRGKNLKGLAARRIQHLSNADHSLVEVEKDVGGGSGDGLGKKGRCIVVPNKILKEKSNKKEKNGR